MQTPLGYALVVPVRTLASLLVLGLGGCGDDGRPPPFCLIDAGPPCDDLYDPPPSRGDADGDGIPDDEDEDADGDGIPNMVENYGGASCAPHDADSDGVDNWLDADSDDDGVPDAVEQSSRTDPYAVDSDGDGFSDLVERSAGTSPTDASSRPPNSAAAVLPHRGGDVMLTLTVDNRIENADVFFLVDTTGSMVEERFNLIAGIQRVVVPALAEEFADVAYGVGGFDDYPVRPYGAGPDGTPGASGDLPFYLVAPMLDGLGDTRHGTLATGVCPSGFGVLEEGGNGTADIVEALAGLGCHNGEDLPEAFVPALWATATGHGLTWPGSEPDAVPAQTDCPPGHRGYPCFRPDAFPIVLLVGDAAFHNGPGGTAAYSFESPTFEEAVEALDEIGAKVLSLFSGEGSDRAPYEELARRTGAIAADGTPLVFDVRSDGSGIDRSVVDAVSSLADGVPQDITIEPRDDPSDTVDALDFVVSFTTGDGRTAGGAPGGYASKDEATFFTVEPRASVDFVLTLRNDSVAPAHEAQVFALIVRARGSAGATFATRTIYVIVPPEGGAIRT